MIDPKTLKHGLYRVWWAEGGTSLAALGSMPNGERWLAPTNWTTPAMEWGATDWTAVLRMERLDHPKPTVSADWRPFLQHAHDAIGTLLDAVGEPE